VHEVCEVYGYVVPHTLYGAMVEHGTSSERGRVSMADSGFVRLPDGSVVVALSLPRPTGPGRIRVLVHAVNRSRALTRLRNLGLRSVFLRIDTDPAYPTMILPAVMLVR
jgi:hypothetical protein